MSNVVWSAHKGWHNGPEIKSDPVAERAARREATARRKQRIEATRKIAEAKR